VKGAAEQGEGRCPDTNMEILAGDRRHLFRRRHGLKRQQQQGFLKHEQHDPEQQGHGRGANHRHHLVVHILAAPGLRDQPGGAHAQEAKGPQQVVEDHAAQANRRQMYRAGQMADRPGIHQPHQRGRGIGQDSRAGDGPDLFMGVIIHSRILTYSFANAPRHSTSASSPAAKPHLLHCLR